MQTVTGFDPAVRNRVLAKRKKIMAAERSAADKRVWGPIDGEMLNRYEVMAYVVERVSEGDALWKVLKSIGDRNSCIPSLSLVRGWCKYHPDFGNEMAKAEEIRGEVLGEQSLYDLLDADATAMSREELGLLKLQTEAKARAAARKNKDFQDKTVVQRVDHDESSSIEDMERRLADIFRSNPGLSSAVAGRLKTLAVSNEG